MNQDTAERWVTISAVLVAGIYAYRRLTETATGPAKVKNLLGVGDLPPLGQWATAWGFTFLVVSIFAEASPGLGGGFAILIAASDLLTNSASVFADVGKQQKADSTVTAGSTVTTGQTQVVTGLANPNQSQGGAQVGAGNVTAGIGGVAHRIGAF